MTGEPNAAAQETGAPLPPASVPAPVPPSGKLLALDVGLARIGVAVCDGLHLTVRPLALVHRRSRNDDFALLAQLVREQDAQAVICGLPINDDGSEGPQAQTTRKWALRLAQALRAINGAPLPVIYWDERFTTYAAQELLASGDLPKQQAALGEDAVAAAVLLQGYLDAMRRGEPERYGRIDLPPRPGQGVP